MYVKGTIKARSRNHCCSGKAINITHYEWLFVSLGIQHAKRMRHLVLSSVACLAVQYFFTLSHIRLIFREIVIEHKMCLIFFTTFVRTTFHSKKNSPRCYHECA